MEHFSIRPAHRGDREQLISLRLALWPDCGIEEQTRELDLLLAGKGYGPAPFVILVAEDARGGIAGFIDAGLRSHADGCDPEIPVGYVEGWYVVPGERRRRLGARLMAAAEQWARNQGCREMASDTWLDNVSSQRAHEALGFEEVDRCVNYRKAL
ncbi:MAG: GNAT family N-acetyltransferase [Bryobacteraceae bacterium]|nr:GNAT family N-acetyltransferase [Bryobacteraceae bacterium]